MKIVSKFVGLFVATFGLLFIVAPAYGAQPIVKYGAEFTYQGGGTWTVKINEDYRELKNVGNRQSALCSQNRIGGSEPCVTGKTYTTNGDQYGNENCVYLQGDPVRSNSWDTVPGDAGKRVCSTEPPSDTNKKVTICTEPGGQRITVTVREWESKYKDSSKAIWEAFIYKTVGGETKSVDAKGDTSLLAFADCKPPKVDEPVTIPAVKFTEKCDQQNTLTLTPGRGYTVNPVTKNGNSWTVTASADEGFVFKPAEGVSSDGKLFTFTKDFKAVENCDLPETGSEPVYNWALGALAIAVLGVLGYVVVRKRA